MTDKANSIDRKISKKLVVMVCVLFLYVLPSLIQFNYSENQKITHVYFGLPMMQTGDEPHYYAVLYSLVNDGDVFLTNNYDNALYNNGSDLGNKKWGIFDRHTRIFDAKNKITTSFNFTDTVHGRIDLRHVPKPNTCVTEISGHPIGLPLFAAILLWPFKNTAVLEHLAIYLTIVFSIIGIYLFYELMLFYHKNEMTAMLFTFVLAFATQYWHYSKTFFAEPYLASFLIISWYLVALKKKYFIPGLLLSFGFLIKYPFAITIASFYFYFAHKYFFDNAHPKKEEHFQIKQGVIFTIPILCGLFFTLYLNYVFTSNPLTLNQAYAVNFVVSFQGIINWLTNLTFGLLTFSPVLIFAFFGIKRFFNEYKSHCITLVLSCLPYFLFWAWYAGTIDGAGGYSARYLVTLIPFLVVFCSFCKLDKYIFRQMFYLLVFLSVIINFLAAFAYPAFLGYPIQTSVFKIVTWVLKLT